jgi:hypothetical protein
MLLNPAMLGDLFHTDANFKRQFYINTYINKIANTKAHHSTWSSVHVFGTENSKKKETAILLTECGLHV